MNKIGVLISSIFMTLGIGIAIPNLIYYDKTNVPQKNIETAKKSTSDILEHPLDFLLITKLIVREKKQEKVLVDAYTFFGLRYAVVEVVLDPLRGQADSVTILCILPPRGRLNLFCN